MNITDLSILYVGNLEKSAVYQIRICTYFTIFLNTNIYTGMYKKTKTDQK